MVRENEELMIKRANKLAQDYRRKHGEDFEKLVDIKLTKHGIPSRRKTIKTEDGTFISDHSYKHYWCESTTHIDKKRVDEFCKKKKLIEKVKPEITNFVLFYEKDFKTQNQKKLKERLKDAGWKAFGGENEIDTYIEIMQKKDAFHKDKTIKVAAVAQVALNLLHKNPLNRKINKKAVFNIAKSIVEHGFITGFFVVPMYDNYKNKNIIGYMLFEGHHRLDAVIYVRDSWDYIIPDLPCIVVDWLCDKDHKKLANLLVKINVEYRKWELKDYIQTHLEIAKILNDVNKQTSYQVLENLRLKSKRLGLGKNTLLYVCGPVKGKRRWLNTTVIEDGVYETTQDEYDNFMTPFIDDIAVNFYEWFKSQESYSIAVYRYFMATLYDKFKSPSNKDDIKYLVAGFKILGTDVPIKVEQFDNDIWDKIENNMKDFL